MKWDVLTKALSAACQSMKDVSKTGSAGIFKFRTESSTLLYRTLFLLKRPVYRQAMTIQIWAFC